LTRLIQSSSAPSRVYTRTSKSFSESRLTGF
jgi:hypothetical protein